MSYDVGPQGRFFCIVMQEPPGANPDQIIAHSDPPALAAAVAIAGQMAAALDHAPRKSMIRWDIKPSNIIVGPVTAPRKRRGYDRKVYTYGSSDRTSSSLSLFGN